MKHLNATRKNNGAIFAPQSSRIAVMSALVASCAAGFAPHQAHALTLKAGVKGSILGTTKYPCATGGLVQSTTSAVLGLLSGKEERAVAEINLKGVKPVKKATLSIRLSALSGMLGTNGLNIGVDAYTGNNKIDITDYQAPRIGSRLLSTNLSGAILGKTLTVDVTSLVNAAINRGDAALGVRIGALSDPLANLGVTVGDVSIATVDNSAPSLQSVSIATSNPTTDSTLAVKVSASDANQDAMTYTYIWSKNGVIIPGETKSTLDLSKPGNGDKGDKITVTVTARDGLATSAPKTSGAVTIANSAPVVGTISVTPTAPKSNSVLTVKVSGSKDADGDTFTTTYQWKKNGADIIGATNATLDLSKVGTRAGDKISVVVTVTDGTNRTQTEYTVATISNSPITLTALSLKSQNDTSSVFTTNSTLFAEARSSDADNTTPTYTFVWSRVHNSTTTVLQTNKGTASTAKLDLSRSGYGDKNDTINLSVTVDDGQGSTDTAARSAKVVNTVPVISALSLSPTAPTPTSILTAHGNATDADVTNGVDTLSFTYKWRIGTRLLTGETGQSLNLSKYAVKAGDNVSVEVRASDGTTLSESETASVTVSGTGTAPSGGSA